MAAKKHSTIKAIPFTLVAAEYGFVNVERKDLFHHNTGVIYSPQLPMPFPRWKHKK